MANILTVPYADVIDEVELFFEHLVLKLEEGRTLWSDMENMPTLDNTDAVVKLAAWAHGEWIWIHPFINGNGRPAR